MSEHFNHEIAILSVVTDTYGFWHGLCDIMKRNEIRKNKKIKYNQLNSNQDSYEYQAIS